ncbi:MAG: YiiX/YebB-like N1pC/P60 family cysteine hydrolase [Candidatus Binatia bacterium]|nr:YiiX/YebB-like N1pC/P60 family cysteine hydrolase [Candidatus Binatia bacterium]
MRWWQRLTEPIRRRVVKWMMGVLTKPRKVYEHRIPNDLAALRSQLRPGDVILVEGDQRISQVIRYLTQSSWSHAALYIGDELRRFRPELVPELRQRFGSDASYLLVEALEDGVVCNPVTKYARHNIRVCRPRGLRREDLDRILAEVTAQLGKPYNVRHVLELARYFFPVSLIPRRYRRAALRYGGEATQVICTTMLARAFASVGFPIIPRVTLNPEPPRRRWFRWFSWLRRPEYEALYEKEDPALVTPRDFDLSPYFDIVKVHHATAVGFDYRRIHWAQSESKAASAAQPAPPQMTPAKVENSAA